MYSFHAFNVSLQGRQCLNWQEHLDRSGHPGSPPDQSFFFELQNHLMDGRRRHPKIGLDFGLCRRPPVNLCVVIDVCQILALLFRVDLVHVIVLYDLYLTRNDGFNGAAEPARAFKNRH